MASSIFYPEKGVKEVGIVKLWLKAAIGATGAVTLNAAGSKGIASITRTSAGLYQITLDEPYAALLMANAFVVFSTLQDLTFQVKAEDVASAKTIDLWCKTAATATDPTDGSSLRVELILKNSSV